jgi:hypothetical protein
MTTGSSIVARGPVREATVSGDEDDLAELLGLGEAALART